MERENRKRAAYRFKPAILRRLHDFVEQHDPPTTQTGVIEAALTEYLDRKERGEDSKRGARR